MDGPDSDNKSEPGGKGTEILIACPNFLLFSPSVDVSTLTRVFSTCPGVTGRRVLEHVQLNIAFRALSLFATISDTREIRSERIPTVREILASGESPVGASALVGSATDVDFSCSVVVDCSVVPSGSVNEIVISGNDDVGVASGGRVFDVRTVIISEVGSKSVEFRGTSFELLVLRIRDVVSVTAGVEVGVLVAVELMVPVKGAEALCGWISTLKLFSTYIP